MRRGVDPYSDVEVALRTLNPACGTKALVVSGANVAYMTAPIDGYIRKVTYILTTATTVAASVLTVAVNGVTAFTISVPIALINTGKVYDILDDAGALNAVVAGDVISITSNAGATAGAGDFEVYVSPALL